MEIEVIRRRNLNTLGVSPKDMVMRLGGRELFWRGLMLGNEPFGQLTARRVEVAYSLPFESLDLAVPARFAQGRAKAAAEGGFAKPRDPFRDEAQVRKIKKAKRAASAMDRAMERAVDRVLEQAATVAAVKQAPKTKKKAAAREAVGSSALQLVPA